MFICCTDFWNAAVSASYVPRFVFIFCFHCIISEYKAVFDAPFRLTRGLKTQLHAFPLLRCLNILRRELFFFSFLTFWVFIFYTNPVSNIMQIWELNKNAGYVCVNLTICEHCCWLTLPLSLKSKSSYPGVFLIFPVKPLWSELLSSCPKLWGHPKPLSALHVLRQPKLTFLHGLVRPARHGTVASSLLFTCLGLQRGPSLLVCVRCVFGH